MNGLDLFSGIGGIGIGLKPFGVRTVAYCERELYAQGVLLSRMQSGDIDRAPIWDDVTTLSASMLPEIDIIFGGFPCQDISTAGRGAGLAGERSGLYFELERLVEETKPAFIFLENVPAIRTRGLGRVVWGLSSLGYDLRWTVVSAAEVGAPHFRKRWFLLAYAASERIQIRMGKGRYKESITSIADSSWWTIEPNVGRVVNGLPLRVDRIKCLGNSVVPFQVETAFKKLIGWT